MEHWQNQFLPDLTTSEGQLARFTRICHVLHRQGKLTSDRVAGLIKESVRLTNIKVIRRHIRVMEVLDLIDQENGLYSISSEGRALCALTAAELTGPLSLAEKIFYVRSLVMSIPIQLTSALIAISENQGQTKDYLATSYGKRLLDHHIPWQSAETMRYKLTREASTAPRKFRNNFDCLLLWLKQLALVDATDLRTTSLGQQLATLAQTELTNFAKKIFWAASTYVCREPGCLPEFDYGNEKQLRHFLALLNESYGLFEIPTLHVSDINAIRLYVCIKLMVEGHVLLDEPSFEQIIRSLSHEGTIQSAMTGRNGKLAYISLGAGAR